MKTRILYSALACLSLVASNAAAVTLSPISTDPRWSAWYGCWRPDAMDGVAPPAHVVCVLPGGGDGVSIATVANGKIMSEQTIIADGTRRATDEGGCNGFESAVWSRDGQRVFLKSELNCGGDIQRISTGVLALITTAAYVDVQTVDVAGQKASRTVRYIALRENEIPTVIVDRLKNEPLARESARMRASAPLDLEDVVEATKVIGSEAVDGLLVARRAGFALNADRLRTLAAAGVKPSTVDVMVALSYPKHFEVAEESRRYANTRNVWGTDNGRTSIGYGNSCYDAYSIDRTSSGYGYDPYASRYGRCGNNSYYSPYGYDAYGWGYGTGQVIVLGPGSVGSKGDEVEGVAVNGQGYTRRGTQSGTARPREATPATTRATGTSSAGAGTASVKGTGSSSGGSTSSGSGTSTGRTAKPRGGGGQ